MIHAIWDSSFEFPPFHNPHETMDRLKLFRLTTFQYFVAQISLAEGSTVEVRKHIWPKLDNSSEIRIVIDRIAQMNTMERLTAMSSFIDLLKNYNSPTRNISQAEWVTRVNGLFGHGGGGSSDAVDNGDPDASVFEFASIKIPGGGDLEHLSTVREGCSLVSLDKLFFVADIPKPRRGQIKREAVKVGNFWRIKRPYRAVDLYINFHDAADICKTHGRSLGTPRLIEWLEKEAPGPPNDPVDRQRLRLLEAVDSTKYIVSFLGMTPGKGHLVLLRASDAHVHVTSFTRSCAGLPLRQRDVRDDDECARLVDLLDGPVNVELDDAQMNALTVPPDPPDGDFLDE